MGNNTKNKSKKYILDLLWEIRKKCTSEKTDVEKNYRYRFGVKPDLKNPQSFNEKIQWLKLYHRPKGLHRYVDKYEVRDYVSKTIGSQYLNEIIGVWDNADQIDFRTLPPAFAIKATHASNTNLICSDKNAIKWEDEKRLLNSYLDYNLFHISKEWAYKHVKPRLIAEHFLSDNGQPPSDYKIFCFNGEPKLIQIDIDRFSKHKRSMLTTDWKPLPVSSAYPPPTEPPARPITLTEQLHLASLLSAPFPFVRIDFYCIEGRTYFGEMTFYPASGYKHFDPPSWDITLGSWLTLPKKTR